MVLVCNSTPDNLPDDVEVQPLSALQEIVEWADYLAFDVARENLKSAKGTIGEAESAGGGEGSAGSRPHTGPMRGSCRLRNMRGHAEIRLEAGL